ncbi:hypothetical protein DYB34_011461, partial [Aphanomyces astaci]
MPSTTSYTKHFINNKCLYRNKVCLNVRAIKNNGQLHNLCDYHRLKANSSQRKLEKKHRDCPITPAATTEQSNKPPRTFGVKELWMNPYDVYDIDTGDDDVVIWVQPIRLELPQTFDHIIHEQNGEALLICFRGGSFSAVLDITLLVAGLIILHVLLHAAFTPVM